MDFELVVVQGRSASSTIKLGDGVTTIGRHDTCQLRIKSSQVSRKHCELFEKKGLLLVKDLKSSNGTIVNGKRIQDQCVLEPGDELTIGPIQLRVAKAGTGAAAVAAKPGGGAGDTAVTEAIAVADEAEHDDFTLDLDAPTQASPAVAVAPPAPAPQKATPKAKAAPPPEDDAFADFLVDMPDDDDQGDSMATTAHIPVAPPTADPKPQAGKPKPEPAQEKAAVKEVEKEPAGSDDAIADFLLDIKLDEEE